MTLYACTSEKPACQPRAWHSSLRTISRYNSYEKKRNPRKSTRKAKNPRAGAKPGFQRLPLGGSFFQERGLFSSFFNSEFELFKLSIFSLNFRAFLNFRTFELSPYLFPAMSRKMKLLNVYRPKKLDLHPTLPSVRTFNLHSLAYPKMIFGRPKTYFGKIPKSLVKS